MRQILLISASIIIFSIIGCNKDDQSFKEDIHDTIYLDQKWYILEFTDISASNITSIDKDSRGLVVLSAVYDSSYFLRNELQCSRDGCDSVPIDTTIYRTYLIYFDGINEKRRIDYNHVTYLKNNIEIIKFDSYDNLYATRGQYDMAVIDANTFTLKKTIIGPSTYYSSLEIDHNNDIWFVAAGHNLYQSNGDNFFKYEVNEFIDNTTFINSVQVDSRNNIWFITNNNLYKFENGWYGVEQQIRSPNIFPRNKVCRFMTIDYEDNIWLYVDNNEYLPDYINNPTEIIKYNQSDTDTIDCSIVKEAEIFISDMEVSSDNFIYISTNGYPTEGGFYVFDGISWILFNNSNSPLPSNNINDLLVDSYGNVWIATNNGVAIYNKIGIRY